MTQPTRSRVVIAEDDSDILELVVFLLNEAGFDTVAVTDGLEALAAIEADPPRLAILDIQMPGMSGIEVLRQIRASAATSDLEVILLSAHALDSDIDTGFAAGASDYVVKPFRPHELLQVKALTERNRAFQQSQLPDLRTHEIILDIGRAIRAASDTQQALDIMCAALGEGLGVDRVLANTVGVQHGGQLRAQWHRPGVLLMGDLAVLPDAEELADELWLAAGFWAEEDLLAVDQPRAQMARPMIQEAGARAGVVVPIGLGDRVMGIIYVITVLEPRGWTPAETDVVQAAAGFVAKAIVAAEHQASQRDYIDRIDRLDRQKSDFLATVSHELRTPLTSISGYLEVLQGPDAGNFTSEKRGRMLDAISRNTDRLRNLIEDVLVLSRIEGGVSEVDFVEVSIRGVITRAGKELAALAQRNTIELKIDAGPHQSSVLGDRASLDRAVIAILSNAIKFGRPGGTVTIIGTQEPDSGRAHITCQDQGFGIPAGDVADLFTRFFRASNITNRAIPGTGLGLNIAKQIVEDHHGELRLTSVENEGTTVVLDLPMHCFEPKA